MSDSNASKKMINGMMFVTASVFHQTGYSEIMGYQEFDQNMHLQMRIFRKWRITRFIRRISR